MPAKTCDVAVVGGGILGMATAWRLLEQSDLSVVVLEAEPELARHQSGRNSGVIHAGLYYRPGSSKARLCTRGRDELYQFCEEHDVPTRRCGKLVLATSEEELPALEELARRARANGLEGVERLEPGEIAEREPCARGVAALWVPQTGVVDFRTVTEALAREVGKRGGEIRCGARVTGIRRQGGVQSVETEQRSLECALLVNCAGLQADRVARLAGTSPSIRILPFRGEYYELRPERRRLVRGLIYPVPDSRFPFLGLHFTRTIDDRVEAGPNAVLALHREGYSWTSFSWRDTTETLSYPGFWRLAKRFWPTGVQELRRSLSRRAFVRSLQRLIPEVSVSDLRPSGAGVRAQAVDREGRLVEDFSILDGEDAIHLLNAPSPAATAALAIGQEIAARARQALANRG